MTREDIIKKLKYRQIMNRKLGTTNYSNFFQNRQIFSGIQKNLFI